MEPRFHGRQIRARDGRDLIERHFFVFGQDQRFALQRRQSLNSRGDRIGALHSHQVDGVARQRRGFVVLDHARFAPPAFQDEISRDPQQVASRGAAAFVECAGLLPKRQKAVLNDILRGRLRAGHAPGKPEQDVLVQEKRVSKLRIGHSQASFPQSAKRFGGRGFFTIEVSMKNLEAYRQEFPVVEKLIYLNHAAVAPLSRRAAQAMKWLAQDALENGAMGYLAWEEEYAKLRAASAKLVNGHADEIA